MREIGKETSELTGISHASDTSCDIIRKINLQKSKWYDNCDATRHVYTGLRNPKFSPSSLFSPPTLFAVRSPGWTWSLFVSNGLVPMLEVSLWLSGPGCSLFSLCLSALCSGSLSCLLDPLLGSSSLVPLPGRWFQCNM